VPLCREVSPLTSWQSPRAPAELVSDWGLRDGATGGKGGIPKRVFDSRGYGLT
jgi:hypothetical protein